MLFLLIVRQADVAVLRFPGHIPPEPVGWLKRSAASLIVKFHFGNDEAVMPAAIDIDLDGVGFPGHVVAHLGQPPARRRGPERFKLLHAQANLALLPLASRPPLVGQGPDRPLLAEANLEATPAHGKISLLNGVVRAFF